MEHDMRSTDLIVQWDEEMSDQPGVMSDDMAKWSNEAMLMKGHELLFIYIYSKSSIIPSEMRNGLGKRYF